jgi:hypothetical protein
MQTLLMILRKERKPSNFRSFQVLWERNGGGRKTGFVVLGVFRGDNNPAFGCIQAQQGATGTTSFAAFPQWLC